MRNLGIVVIILLFIIAGSVKLYNQWEMGAAQRQVPPREEEIILPPGLPAAGREIPLTFEFSLAPDGGKMEQQVSIAPAGMIPHVFAVEANNILSLHLSDPNALPDELHTWPGLAYIRNIGTQTGISISLKTEQKLPPYLSLLLGPRAEILQFDERGYSVQHILLEPGKHIALGVALDLREDIIHDLDNRWKFSIIAD